MMRFLTIAFLLIAGWVPVFATNTVYIGQAAAGANDGTSCASQKAYTYFNSGANWSGSPSGILIGPDTTVHLCGTISGPGGNAANIFQAQGSGTNGHPVTMLFETGTILEDPYFGSSGAIDLNGQSHIVVDGGTACGKLSGGAGSDTACNGRIRNTLAGSPGQTCPAGACTQNFTNSVRSTLIGSNGGNPTDIEVRNLNLGPVYVRGHDANTNGGDTYAFLIAGGAQPQSIRLHNNICTQVFKCYTMSVGGSSTTLADYEFYNNSVSDVCWGMGVGANSSTLHINTVIGHDNEIQNFSNWAYDLNDCHGNGFMWFNGDGGTVFAGGAICESGCLAYNNYVHGDLSGGTLQSSPSGFLSCQDNCKGGVWFNNIINDTCSGLSPSRGCGGPIYFNGAGGGGQQVYNNTVVSTNQDNCILLTSLTAPIIVKNNICQSTANFVGMEVATFTNVLTSDFNDVFNLANPSNWWCNNSASCKTLAQTQALGNDVHSLTGNPNLSGTFRLQSGSTAIGAGTNLTSLGIAALNSDAAGAARPASGAWDVGAYQSSTVTVTVTAPLTGTGTIPASITLSPSSINFGNVLVGSSASQNITLNDGGGTSATITSITATSPFSRTTTCGASIAAGASCTITATATPVTTGTVNGTITVVDSATGSPHVANLSVTGTAPSVAITPASINFGDQPVGTQGSSQNFTLTNSGSAPAFITSAGILGSQAGDFVVTSNTCSAAPTLSDTFSSGVLDGSKWVIDTGNSPAPGSNNTGTFSASNVSLNQGVLDLKLTQVAGTPIISTGAEVRSVNTFGFGVYTWVARAGSTATTPAGGGSAVSGQVSGLFNYNQNNGLTAPNFTENDFEVEGQFPTQLEMTSWSSASPVVNTETNSTQTMDTAFHWYTYIWRTGQIDYYFDGHLVSTHTTNVPTNPAFVIQNFYGTNGASFGGVATTGSTRHLYLTGFSFVPGTGTSVPAGGTCTVGVAFKPTSSGARSSSLVIADSASGSPHTAAVSGNGTSLAVTLSPTSLTFAPTVVGATTAAQVVTLTNIGNITLSIASKVVSGDYAISASSCGATVLAGANCTISVTFTPTATGTRTGTLTITDNANGSPQTVPLTGTGTAPTAPIASISPSSLDFGSVVLAVTSSAQVVTLNNTGNATMNIASIVATGDFTKASTTCGATLAQSVSCTVNVTFTPSALGARSGALTFTDDAAGSPQAVTLTGNGVSAPAPIASISPTSLTFGSTTVGVTSAAQNLTLTNIGNASLNITSVVRTGDFAIATNTCSSSLGAGLSCTVGVTFTPTTTGTRTGTIAFTDNASGSPQTIPLTGTGTAPTAPIANISPLSLTFASQTVGTSSATQGITLTNGGNAPLNITSITPSGDYSIVSTTCAIGGSLAAGASCSVPIRFTPTATGTRTGSVVFVDNAAGSPQSVSLTGTGAAPTFPIATISPTSINFGNQVISTTSASSPVLLQNTGTAPLNITSIVSTGDFSVFSNNCGASVAASASCTVNVRFTPTAIGTRTGALNFTDNASGSPQSVSLTGSGVPAPQPGAVLSPTTLTFPSTFVGSTSAVQDVTLTNNGNATLNIASTAATGDYARTTTCGSTLAAGLQCLIHVTFSPTAPGTRTGTVTVTDDATGSPQTVTLSGVGIATAPAVCLSPTSINFGNQAVGTNSSAKPITLTNCGTANLIVASVTPTGDFTETNNCTTVVPTASCTINAVFAPSTQGTRTGQYSIASNAASTPDLVSLQGFGTTTGATLTSTAAFGHVVVGVTSAPILLTLTNTGNTSLSLSTVTLTGSNPGDFAFSSACGANLAANATCQISTTFTPSAPGARTATLTQPFGGGVASVTSALSGTGDAATPAVTLTPTSLDFGNVTTGVTSASKTVQLQNTGTALLNITSITLTGANLADYARTNHCGATLAIGAICTIDVTATPSGTGARVANLHFIDDAADTPQNVTLTVNGVASPTPRVTLSPTSLAFSPPSITTGSTSAAKNITVTNTGNANLVVSAVTLAGTNPGDFSQTNNCATVAAGATCAITVNFKPTAAGSRSATVSIASNAASSPDTAAITGTGKTGHGKHQVAVTSVNFGNQTVGTTSAPAAFTITNVGDATLNISSISTSGDFSQTNTCSCCIAISTSCSVAVTFDPTIQCGQFASDGVTCISFVHTGQVLIVDDDPSGPATVALSGTATPVPPPPGPITFGFGGKMQLGGKIITGAH